MSSEPTRYTDPFPSTRPATHGAPALEARGLHVAFNRRTVFEAVDLRLAVGETVAVLGANGAGKTTLLRCLAGLLRPSKGELLWYGASARRNPAARRLVGLVTHQPLVYPELTPRENLRFAARMFRVEQPDERVAELLSAAGLESAADLPTARLSHGTRQRLAVARALVHRPPILLLDEPFSGLDDKASEWLGRMLAELREQRTTLCFTSHLRRWATQLADRVLAMADRRLCGSLDLQHAAAAEDSQPARAA